MASSRFVLKGIEDMLKEEVKFFSMVRQNGERMYICLGKRALYLLDFEPPMQQQFYFAWIQTVIIDRDNLLLFQIDMTEGREPLILESFERERLCDELAICWKADFMFRKWSWQTFPLKRGQCDVARRERTALEFTTAPEKMQKIEFGGYLLFADDACAAARLPRAILRAQFLGRAAQLADARPTRRRAGTAASSAPTASRRASTASPAASACSRCS